jgi:hypothetical protein
MISQSERLLNLLKDGRPHRTDEILAKVYGSEHLGVARISARINDIKRQGYQITGYKDNRNTALYWYKMDVFNELFNPAEITTAQTNDYY